MASSFNVKFSAITCRRYRAHAILTEPVSLSTKTELSHPAWGIEKSTKVSLPVVRKPPCLETEIVDDNQNTYVEPMLASPRVKTTTKHSRKNEHEQYNV